MPQVAHQMPLEPLLITTLERQLAVLQQHARLDAQLGRRRCSASHNRLRKSGRHSSTMPAIRTMYTVGICALGLTAKAISSACRAPPACPRQCIPRPLPRRLRGEGGRPRTPRSATGGWAAVPTYAARSRSRQSGAGGQCCRAHRTSGVMSGRRTETCWRAEWFITQIHHRPAHCWTGR